MAHEINHETEQSRFTTSADGHLCVLDYDLSGAVMTITHTGVPPEVGGQGIAGALTRVALDTARHNKWRVIPQCSYAATYIKRHPEYNDLIAST